MSQEHFMSVYDLDMTPDGQIVNKGRLQFNSKDYSRFKYGCNRTTEKYGELLAQEFIKKYAHLMATELDVQNIVVASSAHKYIPTASWYIANFFIRHVNRYLCEKGLESIISLKVHRAKLFQGDYGKLDESERRQIFNDSDLHIDLAFIKNKKVIIIDDIRITGSHERKLSEIIGDQATDIFFLYVATMEQESALKFPQIEDKINHAYINSMDDVFHFISKDRFFINARICKFILEQSDKLQLEKHLERLPKDRLYDIYDACVGDGYCHMDKYRENFKIIRDIVQAGD
jgi:hypothetical protein